MDDEVSNHSTFDIYSDILLEQHDQREHVSVEQLEKANADNEAKVKQLTTQLQNLEAQNAAVVKENEILKTNISQLYRTAQAELSRKDRQLEELTQSRPRYWHEYDQRSSINDRLRDLRKNPRGYPCRTNGADPEHNGDTSANTREDGPPDGRQTGNVRKASKQDAVDPVSNSRRSTQQERTETSSREASPSAVQQQIRDKHVDSPLSAIPKATDNVSTNSAVSYSKDNDSRSKTANKNESEQYTVKTFILSSYIIPKKSSSAHDRPVSNKEDPGRAKSPSDHGLINLKKASHRSTHSPLKYTRVSNKNEKLHRSTGSPSHYPSSESSKSRERSSLISDRSANRSCDERHSGRKRRLSPDTTSSSHRNTRQKFTSRAVTPQKQHKGRSTIGTIDRDGYAVPSSDKTSRRDVITTRKNCSNPGQDTETRRKRHRSRTSSHRKTFTDVSKYERSRKRHESDRKNKSLKRAKETLHKMHSSTPKKHEEHEEKSSRHKHRKHHGLEKHKSAGERGDSASILYREDTVADDRPRRKKISRCDLEEGEMPGSDCSGTFEDLHQDSEASNLGISTCADSQPSATDQTRIANRSIGYNSNQESDGLEIVADQETDEDKNIKEINTPEKTSTQCMLAQVDEMKADTMIQNEVLPNDEISQTDLLKDSSKGESLVDDRNPEAKYMNADVHGEIMGRASPLLTQPGSATCIYASVHETVLICTPSQEEDSSSELDTQSAWPLSMSPSTCKPTASKCETPPSPPPENRAAVHLSPTGGQKSVSSKEGDSTQRKADKVRIDFSNILSNNESGNVHSTESRVEQDVQTNFAPGQKATESEGALKLKPAESPRGIRDDSFSERIFSAFGSVSFLESDDLESSKEAQMLLQSGDSLSLQPEASSPCTLQRSLCGDSNHPTDASACSVKWDGITETMLEVFGSNSFLESDDVDSSSGLSSAAVQKMAESGEPGVLEGNLASTVQLSGSIPSEQLTMKQHSKAGHMAVIESCGSSEFVADDSTGTDTSLLPDQLRISRSASNSLKMETDIVLALRKEILIKRDSILPLTDTKTLCLDEVIHDSAPGKKDELMSEYKKQDCSPEKEDVADISINLTNCDILSCSASPAHSSLLKDSEASQSDRDDNDCMGKDSNDEDFEYNDRVERTNQDASSKYAYSCGSGTPSETNNLSDGEIVSSSDSEAAPPSKTSTSKSGSSVRRSKPDKPTSSRNRSRSRSRDKHAPRQTDRGRRTVRDKSRHESDGNRTKFFQNKMRILQERLKAHDHQDRHHVSYGRDKYTSDRLHPRDRKGHRDEENVRSTVHAKNSTHPDRRQASGKEGGSSSRHSETHSSRPRGHDTGMTDRHRKKPERGSVNSEARSRDIRSRVHRR